MSLDEPQFTPEQQAALLERAIDPVRPRAAIAVFNEKPAPVLESFLEVMSALREAAGDLAEFTRYDAGGDHARLAVSPEAVVTVIEITEGHHELVSAELDNARATSGAV